MNEHLNPIKILLTDGKWYTVKPNTFELVDNLMLPYIDNKPWYKFKCSDEIIVARYEDIKGFVNGS